MKLQQSFKRTLKLTRRLKTSKMVTLAQLKKKSKLCLKLLTIALMEAVLSSCARSFQNLDLRKVWNSMSKKKKVPANLK
jgi:hypothetical protein